MAKDVEKPGQIFEDTLAAAIKLPGVHINREKYLRASLKKYCDEETIRIAVEESPAAAKIPPETIRRIADDAIKYESAKVTAISTVAGIPGGFAMFGTLPADMAQYFAHAIRLIQKLAYIYSWPDLFSDEGEMDDATRSILTLFMGVMFGVNVANGAVTKVAGLLAANATRRLPQMALTRGAIYPVVRRIARSIGVRMTTRTFANGVGKIIPVVGGVISGGITYAGFRPMAVKLRNYLADLPVTNAGAEPKTFEKQRDYDNIVDAEVMTESEDPEN